MNPSPSPSRPSPLRALLVLLVALLVGRHLVLVVRALTLTDPVDLGAYYLHARMLWEGADPSDAAQLQAFAERLGLRPLRGVNPPTFYFLFLPFALLPWAAARALWVLVLEAALWATGWVVWRELKAKGAGGGEAGLLVAGFLAVFYPAQQALALGQVDLLLGLVAAALGVALARGREGVAGVLALAAGGLKVQLAAVPVFLIAAGRLRRGIGALVGFGALWVAATLAAFGPGAVTSYFRFVTGFLGEGLNPDPVNYSLNGLLARTVQPWAGAAAAEITYSILAATVALLSLGVLLLRPRPGEQAHWVWVGFLFLTVWMISPTSEEHHLAWLAAPLLLACFAWAPGAGRAQAVLFLSALLLVGVQHYPHSLFAGPGLLAELLRSSKLLGPAILWGLSAWALMRTRPAGEGRSGEAGHLPF